MLVVSSGNECLLLKERSDERIQSRQILHGGCVAAAHRHPPDPYLSCVGQLRSLSLLVCGVVTYCGNPGKSDNSSCFHRSVLRSHGTTRMRLDVRLRDRTRK